MNLWWTAAAAISAATVVIHVTLGGRDIARPLLALAQEDKQLKFGNYYCWHLVSIEITGLSLAFAWPAMTGRAQELAIAATMISISATGWSLAMITRFRLGFLEFPQWALFLPISLCGLAGGVL